MSMAFIRKYVTCSDDSPRSYHATYHATTGNTSGNREKAGTT